MQRATHSQTPRPAGADQPTQWTPGLLGQGNCMQTAHRECSYRHPISWIVHTHKKSLSMLAVTGKRSTWKHVNILTRYMFSFQRMWEDILVPTHSQNPSSKKIQWPQESWYSFEFLTKLVFSITGASRSYTKSQIHPAWQSTVLF